MNQLNKKLKLNLIVGIGVSVIFICCLPMAVMACIEKTRSLLTIVFAGVCVFSGGYGLPFVWCNFYRLYKMKALWKLIQEGCSDYQSLAEHSKLSKRRTKRYVNRLFAFGYISAVEITEEPTASFDKNTFKPKAKKCKGCGNTYVKDSQETVCPYCQRYN